jgi:hypothetical protein
MPNTPAPITNPEARDNIDKFYNTLSTLPKLIGDLGIDIAEAQRRLDQNYLDELAAFTKMVRETFDHITVEQYLALFKAMAPSRYQFTETAIEVRADLQTASSSELNIGVEVGIKTAVFSLTANVSYLKRTASDYQAAAVIRSVLNAVPADPGLLEKLLARGVGSPPEAQLTNPRYQALADAFAHVVGHVASPPHS